MLPTNLIYEFPSRDTWVENIAVRPNGHLLLTLNNRPELWSLDPSTTPPTATLVHTFSLPTDTTTPSTPLLTRLGGITALPPPHSDRFALIAGHLSGAPAPSGPSWLFTVDFAHGGAQAPRVALATSRGPVPGSKLLNGLAALGDGDGCHAVLAADSGRAAVYRIPLDASEGPAEVVLQDEATMAGVLGTGGVNGLRVVGDWVYYTNTLKGCLARVRIDVGSGKAVGGEEGRFEVVVKGLGLIGVDDFAVTADGETAFVVNNLRHKVYRVDIREKNVETVAEGTILRGPCSAQIGGDGRTLYVVTNGGAIGIWPKTAGKVVAVQT